MTYPKSISLICAAAELQAANLALDFTPFLRPPRSSP